jgi:hypothetical protein
VTKVHMEVTRYRSQGHRNRADRSQGASRSRGHHGSVRPCQWR